MTATPPRSPTPSRSPAPPATPATDHVDDLHGRRVPDPYRWLEDTTDPAVQAWIDAQNAYTDAWFAESDRARAEHEAFRARLETLTDRPRAGVPWRRGDRWFQLRNAGLEAQPVLWVADAPEAEGRRLVDPGAEFDDATTALAGFAATRDGGLLAYALAHAGSDWRSWFVRDVDTGEDLDDRAEWSKFSPAAWHPDGSGFFYGAYQAPTEGDAYLAPTQRQRLAFHRLGEAQASDATVLLPDEPDWVLDPVVSDDGRWLLVAMSQGTDPRTRVWVAELLAGGVPEPRPLLDEFDASYEVLDAVDGELYVLTDAEAPLGRVVAVPLDGDGSRGTWREVVAEAPDETLERAVLAGDDVLTLGLADASSRVRRHTRDGRVAGSVDLPERGTVADVTGHPGDPLVHFSFASFTRPSAVHRHDLATGVTEEVPLPGSGPLPFDPDRFVTDRLVAKSADGTRVPLFLVRRRELAPATDGPGAHPTLLWGYGGFRVPVTPMYRTHWLAWVERGGLLAVPNLRGGGEYGAGWHDDGRLSNKQHVFDDAIAVAETLVSHGWTRPERLAVKGRSNGGLLAGACLTQRPDLFGAAVVEVGVLDMVRFPLSTIGWAWKSDYGDPDDPEDLAVLLEYSPVHRVTAGTAYPATLITTGDHDDRVVPGHSFKFAAALQAAQAGDAPVLLRVDRSGGHGAGKPTGMVIEERAAVMAFLADRLGLAGPGR